MKPSRQPVISASPLPQEARAAAEASLEAALNAGADVHTRCYVQTTMFNNGTGRWKTSFESDSYEECLEYLAVNEQAKRVHPRCKRIVASHWTDGYVVNGPLSS